MVAQRLIAGAAKFLPKALAEAEERMAASRAGHDAALKMGREVLEELYGELGKNPELYSMSQLSKTPGWEKESLVTPRGLRSYICTLGQEIEKEIKISGAKILDVGAGERQEFAKDVRMSGYPAKVISLDPALSLPLKYDLKNALSKSSRLAGRLNPESGTLAGLADALPFKDNSFNSVYASHSIPLWSPNSLVTEQSIAEFMRVLKPGGTMRMFPVNDKEKVEIETYLAHKGLSGSWSGYLNDGYRLVMRK